LFSATVSRLRPFDAVCENPHDFGDQTVQRVLRTSKGIRGTDHSPKQLGADPGVDPPELAPPDALQDGLLREPGNRLAPLLELFVPLREPPLVVQEQREEIPASPREG
jgi:hypothetical protein